MVQSIEPNIADKEISINDRKTDKALLNFNFDNWKIEVINDDKNRN